MWCGVVWCGVVWCGVVWSSPQTARTTSGSLINPPALPYHMYHHCFTYLCFQMVCTAICDVNKHHVGGTWTLRTCTSQRCNEITMSFQNSTMYDNPFRTTWKRAYPGAPHPRLVSWDPDKLRFLSKIKWICWLQLLSKSSTTILNTFEYLMTLQ